MRMRLQERRSDRRTSLPASALLLKVVRLRHFTGFQWKSGCCPVPGKPWRGRSCCENFAERRLFKEIMAKLLDRLTTLTLKQDRRRFIISGKQPCAAVAISSIIKPERYFLIACGMSSHRWQQERDSKIKLIRMTPAKSGVSHAASFGFARFCRERNGSSTRCRRAEKQTGPPPVGAALNPAWTDAIVRWA